MDAGGCRHVSICCIGLIGLWCKVPKSNVCGIAYCNICQKKNTAAVDTPLAKLMVRVFWKFTSSTRVPLWFLSVLLVSALSQYSWRYTFSSFRRGDCRCSFLWYGIKNNFYSVRKMYEATGNMVKMGYFKIAQRWMLSRSVSTLEIFLV